MTKDKRDDRGNDWKVHKGKKSEEIGYALVGHFEILVVLIVGHVVRSSEGEKVHVCARMASI